MAEAPDKSERALGLQTKVSELEGFVAEALRRGTPAKELREICRDAVQHSKRKASLVCYNTLTPLPQAEAAWRGSWWGQASV
jgi:hypothetical protein